MLKNGVTYEELRDTLAAMLEYLSEDSNPVTGELTIVQLAQQLSTKRPTFGNEVELARRFIVFWLCYVPRLTIVKNSMVAQWMNAANKYFSHTYVQQYLSRPMVVAKLYANTPMPQGLELELKLWFKYLLPTELTYQNYPEFTELPLVFFPRTLGEWTNRFLFYTPEGEYGYCVRRTSAWEVKLYTCPTLAETVDAIARSTNILFDPPRVRSRHRDDLYDLE